MCGTNAHRGYAKHPFFFKGEGLAVVVVFKKQEIGS